MDKGGAARSVQTMLEKEPAPSLERSPGQIIKPFRKKKRTRRRGVKRRPCQWCPPQTKLKIHGRQCSLQAFIYKRVPPQCHETSYGNVKLGSPPSKATNSGWSNIPGLAASRRNSSGKGIVESSEKRRDFSSVQEGERQLRKPSVVEKRRRHMISEYQFIYPGKAIFLCTRETVKQHLRSIYLGNAGQKPAKATQPLPVRILPGSCTINRTRQNTCLANNAAAGRCPTDAEKPESSLCSKNQNSPTQTPVENEPHRPLTAKGNPSPSTRCPVGSALLRSGGPFSAPPQGLPEPSYKINQSVSVRNKPVAAPEKPPPAPTVIRKVFSRPNPPTLEEAPRPPAEEGCHRVGGCPTQNRGQRWDTHQRYSPELPEKDVENVVTALSAGSPKSPRPVSAKECPKDAPSQPPSKGEDHNEERSENDAPMNKPARRGSSKLSFAKAPSAVKIPTTAPYSSSESTRTEASWGAGSTPNLFGIFGQTPLGESRQAGPPACSTLEKMAPGNALGGRGARYGIEKPLSPYD